MFFSLPFDAKAWGRVGVSYSIFGVSRDALHLAKASDAAVAPTALTSGWELAWKG